MFQLKLINNSLYFMSFCDEISITPRQEVFADRYNRQAEAIRWQPFSSWKEIKCERANELSMMFWIIPQLDCDVAVVTRKKLKYKTLSGNILKLTEEFHSFSSLQLLVFSSFFLCSPEHHVSVNIAFISFSTLFPFFVFISFHSLKMLILRNNVFFHGKSCWLVQLGE